MPDPRLTILPPSARTSESCWVRKEDGLAIDLEVDVDVGFGNFVEVARRMTPALLTKMSKRGWDQARRTS